MENRSKAILGMEDSAFARSLFKSMGYTDSELKEGKPLIGIANTWNTLVPGHYNLDKVAGYKIPLKPVSYLMLHVILPMSI